MTLYHWSQTAANNGTADVTCPFPEGMGAPALNDGARGMMAAVAKYRDDMAGVIVTTGSANAYSVASFQGFDSTTDMDGKVISFSPHVTNADTVTLGVDGLGFFPLRSSPGVEILAGTMILGTPYAALFNKTAGEFYLKGAAGTAYNVPFLGAMDFWDTIAPNSAFIFPQGQAISRTVYSRAFARWGTKFGPGDGANTFNVPDKTGRVSAMLEAVGTRLTTAISGVDGGTIGSAGGLQGRPVAQVNLAAFDLSGVNTITVTSPSVVDEGGSPVLFGGGSISNILQNANQNNALTSSGVNTITVHSGGSGTPLNTTPPLIVCNYVIRII